MPRTYKSGFAKREKKRKDKDFIQSQVGALDRFSVVMQETKTRSDQT